MVNKCSAGKENVPLALEVMHETTITAARSYFPNRRDAANFLEILTLGGLFRTLRKYFCQIYWKCCDQWEQKNCFKELWRIRLNNGASPRHSH